MKKKLLSLALALTLCLSLLPVTASAAKDSLPDWYFLFAIFKNLDADVTDGNLNTTHQKYSVPQEEIDVLREFAVGFEDYMNSTGVMRAHVEVVEIDRPITELQQLDEDSSRLRVEQAAPLLEEKVDLDRYDHVTCLLNLNTWMRWAGLTLAEFENGTGLSNINYHNWEHLRDVHIPNEKDFVQQVYVHEFLHFMERMSSKWGSTFVLHREGKTHYERVDNWKTYYTDAMLNRLDGDLDVFPDGGTGVNPAAWQYPPHVLRTMTELTVPSGVTSIGDSAFRGNTKLTSITIPDTVTSIGAAAFRDCTSLTKVTIPGTVASVGDWAFGGCTGLTEVNIQPGVATLGSAAFHNCTGLTKVTIPGTVHSVGVSAFYDCTGLTEVNILPGVTAIEGFAFRGCSDLTRLSIPASVASIGDVGIGNVGSKIDLCYSGTEAQWKSIQVGENNGKLDRASIRYNSLMADVKASDWFAGPVVWALGNGVTAGTGDGNFSPNAACTQAQILTFLWRACGSPVPAEKVSDSAYYAVPLQWAKEQNITSGTAVPENPCTRSDVVTYLWRLAGSPKAGATSFTDVPSNAGYAQAVSWAVQKGVTAGLSDTQFGPDSICTRGQIVTFLCSALAA